MNRSSTKFGGGAGFSILAGWIVLVLMAALPSAAGAMGDYSRLVIPQIRYQGGHFKPRPQGLASLLGQVAKRTSVEVKRVSLDLKLGDPELYRYPLIYLAGDDSFDPLSIEDIKRLRHFLNYGGFLLIDDNSARIHSAFDTSVRRMISRLFPHNPLQKLPRDHSIYRSFYLIKNPGGRVMVNPYLEGITIKGRTVLVYCANDLGGAWSRGKLGHWNYEIIGGGSRQRKLAVRLGVNIVMYALTLDYKKDMVHLPIILDRLRRYHSP